MPFILTVLDTVGIQPYVFGSNVLRENIGASHLVYQATRVWPLKIVHEMGSSNVTVDQAPQPPGLDWGKQIEVNANLKTEIVYAGGGNCVILSRAWEHAQELGEYRYAQEYRQSITLTPCLAQVRNPLPTPEEFRQSYDTCLLREFLCDRSSITMHGTPSSSLLDRGIRIVLDEGVSFN